MYQLIQHCRDNNLRITVGLQSILEVLESADLPLSLQELETHPKLENACDRATIFRTLQRLEGIGLLRRLNFSHSGAKFTLKTEEGHQEYLICRECGDVKALQMSCPVHKIQEDLTKQSGYSGMTHELTFYGLCKLCQPK